MQSPSQLHVYYIHVGCVNVVCSDKTGTLTENCMEVTQLYTASHRHASVGKGGAVCEGCDVTPTTHPDIIKVIEVRRRLTHGCLSLYCKVLEGEEGEREGGREGGRERG